jgi:serine/threonine-protein kinase
MSAGTGSGTGVGTAGSSVPLGTVLEVRFLSGQRAGEHQMFFDAVKVRIGRNPVSNDVVLPDPGVSRQHAELRREGAGYVLADLGSTAGTLMLPAGERVAHLPIAMSGAGGSVEVSLGQIGTAPRLRIGIGVGVPFGRYLLTGRLGGGGMAEVFLARQTGLGGLFRPVALKLIQPEMFDLVDATAMFLDEARIAAEIGHHNVVKIFDVGEHDGVLYLAMEYLRGVTLSNLAAQFHQRGERLPPDLVAALLSQACSGLHAAHQLRDASGRLLNVVHRDVSPSNLMLLPEGLVKVIDFGVARADQRLVRKEEGLQGKPAYMSPEQIQSQPLDCRSDVFALGVVLYELCAGQPLFWREDMVATFYAVVRGEVPPLRSVCPTASPLLEAVVAKALAKQPNDRFQSAADLGAELDHVVLEAGGRFSSIAAVARYLRESGLNLVGAPPALLTQVPKALYGKAARSKPPVGPSSAEAPQAEPARPAQLAPLTREPQRLLHGNGLILDGRYRLVRALTTGGQLGRALPKLWYLAELLRDGEEEARARSLGMFQSLGPPTSVQKVAVALCGRGEHLGPLGSPTELALLHGRLREWAASRRADRVPPSLLPVLHWGVVPPRPGDDPDGGGAAYVVMPYVPSRLSTLGPLGTADALRIVRELLRALAELGSGQAGGRFVHGALDTDRIAVLPPVSDEAGPRVVFLDFDLELVLGLPVPRPTQGPESQPHLAPERFGPRPEPTPQSDLFAVGAIAYQLLGGDLSAAARTLQGRREAPPLRLDHGLPGPIVSLVSALMSPDPAARPDPVQALRDFDAALAPPSSQSPSSTPFPPTARHSQLVRVELPLAGSGADGRELLVDAAHRVLLTGLSVPLSQRPAVQPLRLGGPADLLPASLTLLTHGEALQLTLDAPGRGRDRPGLYLDAYDPNTRCEQISLLPNASAAGFDVGHRRTTVRRVLYSSTVSTGAPARLAVPVPDLGIEVSAASPLRRLVVLYTLGEGGSAYALAIGLV